MVSETEKINKMLVKKIAKLRAENEAKTKVNMFLAGEWNELKTSQNMAETLGLDPKMGNDVAILQFAQRATEFIEEAKNKSDFFEKEFHKTLDHQADAEEDYEKKIEELERENHKLKKGIEKLTSIIKMLDQREEVKKLKAENEELKKDRT
tara:strand:- start:2472 stop:2924 length:453 start_codon:yes stop_codon:yes gene_type:complete